MVLAFKKEEKDGDMKDDVTTNEKCDAPKPGSPIDNLSMCGIHVDITYLDTTISRPIHRDPFMHIYFIKIYKFIKTVYKSLSYNSLIYKILHVKSSFIFLQKGFSKP